MTKTHVGTLHYDEVQYVLSFVSHRVKITREKTRRRHPSIAGISLCRKTVAALNDNALVACTHLPSSQSLYLLTFSVDRHLFRTTGIRISLPFLIVVVARFSFLKLFSYIYIKVQPHTGETLQGLNKSKNYQKIGSYERKVP